MQPSDENPDRAALRALEIAMREVLEGMQELSLQVAYSHADFHVPILDAEVSDAPLTRPSADVIPFTRLHRASGK